MHEIVGDQSDVAKDKETSHAQVVIDKVGRDHEQKDNVGNQVGNDVGENVETGRGELVDQGVDIREIGIAHGLIVDLHNHLDDLELQPLRHFGHHAILEPAVAVVQGSVQNHHQDEIPEKGQGHFRFILLQVLDNIGGNEGYAIGLQNINRNARQYHQSNIPSLFA